MGKYVITIANILCNNSFENYTKDLLLAGNAEAGLPNKTLVARLDLSDMSVKLIVEFDGTIRYRGTDLTRAINEYNKY